MQVNGRITAGRVQLKSAKATRRSSTTNAAQVNESNLIKAKAAHAG
jgi:hypothetical protein